MSEQEHEAPAAEAAESPETAVTEAETAEVAAPEAVVGVATDGIYYLIVAQFPDTAAATAAYDELRHVESTTTLSIAGVVVANRDAEGKVHLEKLTEHSTKTGTKWGIVGGIVAGVIFPPSLLAGAVAGGIIGAAIGKIGNILHRSEVQDELANVLEPGTSGILALVEDEAAAEVQRALAKADKIVTKSVDKAVAMQIDAEAAAAKDAAGV